MSNTLKFIAIIAELVTLLVGAADGADAIVEIADATGVIVSPSGLTLTCRHGLPPDRVDVIHPRLGTLDGKIVYVPEMVDGVVAIQLPQGDYDYIPVSPRRPRLHESVTVHAFGNRSRSGKVGSWRWETCQYYGGQKVRVNHCTAPIEVGWSGGPMLDSDGNVCGIALMGSPRDSLYAGWEETSSVAQRFAWNRVNDKPTIDVQPANAITVHVTAGCIPCEQFKRDYAAGYFAGYSFTIVDGGASLYPLFKWQGGSVAGYNGVDWLRERLPKPTIEQPAAPPVVPVPVQPAAPKPIQPPVQEQPPPAPAARVEPSTEVQPTTAVVWGWGLSLAQIGIAVATGGVGAGAVTAAGKLWGLRSRRKRSQGEPASAGETRAGPHGPNPIKYNVPPMSLYRIPHRKAIDAIQHAFDRGMREHALDDHATSLLERVYNYYRMAMNAPDQQGD